jgi:hypothetical protein
MIITHSSIDGEELLRYTLQQNLEALNALALIVGEEDQRIKDCRAAFLRRQPQVMGEILADIRQGI